MGIVKKAVSWYNPNDVGGYTNTALYVILILLAQDGDFFISHSLRFPEAFFIVKISSVDVLQFVSDSLVLLLHR